MVAPSCDERVVPSVVVSGDTLVGCAMLLTFVKLLTCRRRGGETALTCLNALKPEQAYAGRALVRSVSNIADRIQPGHASYILQAFKASHLTPPTATRMPVWHGRMCSPFAHRPTDSVSQ